MDSVFGGFHVSFVWACNESLHRGIDFLHNRMFAGGPIAGKLYDNYGPRWILLVGSFLHVFGLMMASISSDYYQFLLSQGIFRVMSLQYWAFADEQLYRGL